MDDDGVTIHSSFAEQQIGIASIVFALRAKGDGLHDILFEPHVRKANARLMAAAPALLDAAEAALACIPDACGCDADVAPHEAACRGCAVWEVIRQLQAAIKKAKGGEKGAP